MKSRNRAGFSLMEVLLATGILLASVIILGELASIGRKHANSARDQSKAQLLCQNKMGEMLAGIAPLEEVEDEPFPHENGWTYTVTRESADRLDLVAVRVTVHRETDNLSPARSYSLVRLLRDESSSLGEMPAGPGQSSFDTLSPSGEGGF